MSGGPEPAHGPQTPGAGRAAAGGRPLVKVCGVTRPADAALAVELGAAMIGINFYPPSPRYVAPERAAEIARAVAGAALVVGVFVGGDPGRVEAAAERAGVDLVQLHGDEPPAVVERFAGRAIKVFRVEPAAPGAHRGAPSDPPAPDLLAPYPGAWGFLFDVRHPRLWGGTGEGWRWTALAGLTADRAGRGARPVLVAGGIRPDNAGAALAASGADGVDLCSGVETAPGIKDRLLLQRLFAEIFDGPSPDPT